MTKRIISALLCIIVISLAFAVPTFAVSVNDFGTKIADIKLYADEQVKIGTEFEVTVYIENITADSGILSNDLPLYYDKEKISIVSVEAIFPQAWGVFGDFLGQTVPTEYPYYLRSVPDTSDVMTNPVYRITKSKEIGYKVKFKANKLGDAFVSVEADSAGKYPIMLVSIVGNDINNYGANGMKITVAIVDELGGYVSEDISGGSDVISTEESEDISNNDSADTTTSVDTEISGDTTADDTTAEESKEVSELTSKESSNAQSTDTSSDDGNNKADKTGSIWIYIVIAVIAISVIIVGVVIWMNKSKKA